MSRFTNFTASQASRLWHRYSTHRQAVAEAKERAKTIATATANTNTNNFQLADLESESLSHDERIKSAFSQFVGLFAPFVLACILSLSNGYFFAGFHDPQWTLQIMLAYIGGAVLEMIGLAAIFRAQQALKEGTRSFFYSAFLFALALAAISLVAQYLYLQIQEMQGTLIIPDAAIARIPIVNWLIGINGMQGHDWLFLIRGGAFHLAELGCTFLISKKQKSLKRLIAQQREMQEARLTWQRNELILQMEQGIAKSMIDMLSQQQELAQSNFTRIVDAMKQPTGGTPDPLALPALQVLSNGKNGKNTK